jgi:hypothetical protein
MASTPGYGIIKAVDSWGETYSLGGCQARSVPCINANKWSNERK